MTFLIAFTSMFFMDLFFGFYTITASEKRATAASRWAVTLAICNLIVATKVSTIATIITTNQARRDIDQHPCG